MLVVKLNWSEMSDLWVLFLSMSQRHLRCVVFNAEERWHLRLYLLASGVSNDKSQIIFDGMLA